MAGARSSLRTETGAWIAWGVIAAVFLYILLMQGALDLGVAHHDAFCPEHGWAV